MPTYYVDIFADLRWLEQNNTCYAGRLKALKQMFVLATGVANMYKL